MEKQVCWWLALFLFLDFTDSLTLTVPELVTGQLRNSVNIPCTYHPSPFDRGTYTCEVKWQTKHGLNQTETRADVNLIVRRALPSTRPPASLSPVVTSACGFSNVKIDVWVFALTVSVIILIFSVIVICIVLWKRTKAEHLNELSSARYESFPYPASTNVVISGNNEYETMTTMKENEYSVICAESTCAYAQCHASV
ncbi:uncharacterized protein LOC132820173 isoform X4 [Hemiscyllium ocellatum]|uniref:uncharacterized protein LOC132820173 isoform X4 n=1 Tax=Hemiscyllium ocellatum TaxID=170820 RepID=UPI002966DAAE|nr:uncharacterized protein LOC132820173 isoform X4 [Hemiscyllium ocellatum]